MVEVISGFSVIWVIILVGYVTGKTKVLGPHGQPVLSRTAFFVASPALLFVTLQDADVRTVLGPQLLIAAISAGVAVGLYIALAKWWLPKRKGSELFLAGMSSSMVNSANLGLPIAAYVLGDAALAAPVIIFQLAIYTPIYAFALDTMTAKERAASGEGPQIVRRGGFFYGLWQAVLTILRNPMIIGSAVGLIFSATGWRLPEPLFDSIEMIGNASIPAMLLGFGMSLVGSKPLEKASGRRWDVILASSIKLIIHPVIAWLLAQYALGLDAEHVLTAVVLASLPTAQNVFVAASRYNTGFTVSKDTVLVTTITAIPMMILVAVIFS